MLTWWRTRELRKVRVRHVTPEIMCGDLIKVRYDPGARAIGIVVHIEGTGEERKALVFWTGGA